MSALGEIFRDSTSRPSSGPCGPGSTGVGFGAGLLTALGAAFTGAFFAGFGARALAALGLACGFRALAAGRAFFFAAPAGFFFAALREFVALPIRDHANVCKPSLSTRTDSSCCT